MNFPPPKTLPSKEGIQARIEHIQNLLQHLETEKAQLQRELQYLNYLNTLADNKHKEGGK